MPSGSGSDRAHTVTVVGIDEAGYGPLLGPLVVSAVAFDIPASMWDAQADGSPPDGWDALRGSVTRHVSRRDPRLCVADSKVLFKRSAGRGLSLLERAVLTFLSQATDPPTALRDLLGRLCPDVLPLLQDYPWYAEADLPLPVEITAADVRTQRNAVKADLQASGIRVRCILSEVLPAGHFNRRVEATRNKAIILFGLTTCLMQRVARTAGVSRLCVLVDRQGGRMRYRKPLMTAFQDARLEILEESPDRCGYRLTAPAADWFVHFVTKGESHHLPIALASVVSKYVRELMMICFNRYWSGHICDLQPTAGYYEDGRRFLSDIGEVMTRLKIDPRWVARLL